MPYSHPSRPVLEAGLHGFRLRHEGRRIDGETTCGLKTSHRVGLTGTGLNQHCNLSWEWIGGTGAGQGTGVDQHGRCQKVYSMVQGVGSLRFFFTSVAKSTPFVPVPRRPPKPSTKPHMGCILDPSWYTQMTSTAHGDLSIREKWRVDGTMPWK